MTWWPASRQASDAAAVVIAVIAVLAAFRPALPAADPGQHTIPGIATRLASGGTDASGRSWPLLVHAGGERWQQPVPVHATAALVRAGLGADTAVHLLAGLAGSLSAWMIYVLGLRLFGTPAPALAGALLFAVSPGYLALAGAGDMAVLLVPGVLGWAIAVLSYLVRPKTAVLALGAAALAIGVYAQPAGVLLAPVYLSVGLILVWRLGVERRAYAWIAAGSLAPLVPLALWYAWYPGTWTDTMGRWAVHLAHIRDPWQGLVAFTRWDVAGRRAGDYWHYFSPDFLFVSGSVFAVAVGVLLVAGLAGGLLARRADATALLMASFLVAPASAVLLDEPRSIALAVALLPFGALLAALGAERLWRSDSVILRSGAAVLLGLAVLQGAWLW